ncbi:MAG: GNAT family N-acetyltransferase [Bacteroidota bacterium]
MTLETQRLILRPTTADDSDRLFEMFTDAHIRKYLFDDVILSRDQVEEFLNISIKSFQAHSYGLWMIIQRDSNIVVGFAGLWNFFEETQPQLLYALMPAYTRQGFASEASQAVIDYSFRKLGFDYLVASCDTPNISSHRVAEHIGMKKFKEELINEKMISFFRIDVTR